MHRKWDTAVVVALTSRHLTPRLHVCVIHRIVSLCACLCMTVVGGGHLSWQHTACSNNQKNSQQVGSSVCTVCAVLIIIFYLFYLFIIFYLTLGLFALYKGYRESLIVSHTAWIPWWLCSVLQLIQTDEEDMEML